MLDTLLHHVRDNGRICPIGERWNQLWQMLPSRRSVGHECEPPLPLILGAWWDTPALMKMMRLEEHIRYAEAHGVLAEIDRYLRGLPEEEWAHRGDFSCTPAESRGAGAND